MIFLITACTTTTPQTTNTNAITNTNQSATTGKSFTLAEVQQGNTPNNCLTIINGKVYNLSNYANQHPGGTMFIYSLCGTDGTTAFENQHGGQGRPANTLQSYEVGTLSR